jgi:hypothetical protein
MKRLLAVLLLACGLMAGCSSEQERVQQTGKAINLMPTKQESRAGY